MNVILALDVGSSSIRCTAYSVDNNSSISAIKDCSVSLQVRSVRPNTGIIQLAYGTESLMDKIDECIYNVLIELTANTSDFQVVAVGFSTFVMNLIAIDRDGNVLGDRFTLSYACNTPEVAHECQNIRNKLGPERLTKLYQQTGAPIHSAYALAQLQHMYSSAASKDLNRIYKWQTLASLCIGRWTGKTALPISYSEASWTGLLNFRECAYDFEATELLPKGALGTLPALADYAEVLPSIPEFFPGNKKNKYWSLWPELRHARLFLGVGDGACANIGSKCSTESRIAVTIGTSAAARICLPLGIGLSCRIVVPQGLFCYRLDRGHILLGGALTDGGSVVEWASQLLNLSTEESFLDCINKTRELVEADYEEDAQYLPANISMIPFLSGERSTGFRDGASCAIMGLTRETTPAHLFKSCFEGVSLRLRAILRLIQEARGNGTTRSPPIIVGSGKALEMSALWRQMIADSSGLKVLMDLDTYEGTSRGLARLIAMALNSEEGASSGLKFEDEELTSFNASDPRQKARAYFERAAEGQDRFLEAVTALYTSTD